MKSSNLVFEIVMIAVTILLGFTVFVSKDSQAAGIVWLLILGFIQVPHSIILGISYWGNIKIRKAIIVYWSGVLITFLFIPSNNLLNQQIVYNEVVTILILPVSLAFFLLWITWYFCNNIKKDKSP
jgi:hypothetical protein